MQGQVWVSTNSVIRNQGRDPFRAMTTLLHESTVCTKPGTVEQLRLQLELQASATPNCKSFGVTLKGFVQLWITSPIYFDDCLPPALASSTDPATCPLPCHSPFWSSQSTGAGGWAERYSPLCLQWLEQASESSGFSTPAPAHVAPSTLHEALYCIGPTL